MEYMDMNSISSVNDYAQDNKKSLTYLSSSKKMLENGLVRYSYKMEHTILPRSPEFRLLERSNPGHDYPEDTAALDLCVRKNSKASPNYPYDYQIPYCYNELNRFSPTSEVSDVSSTEQKESHVSSTKMKCSRPFKAYPKDPLCMPIISATSTILGKDSSEAYVQFREKILARAQVTQNGTNKNMRRTQTVNTQNSDPTYWEKRKKNNEAAKRSRDARRAKEDEIAIRCAFLEQENIQLKLRLAALENERERLQTILYH
ncbi:thyrotroph embryonic factor-like [Diorhabda carinulata]|uniref:thyrotroph embryonic factor-like n=1 Tax=Diorhabda carinulata TaxID=1163345 RepID=UPI0025A22B5C|nr:thyrotroph embryonic factor-like [Diorhabda carinulata]